MLQPPSARGLLPAPAGRQPAGRREQLHGPDGREDARRYEHTGVMMKASRSCRLRTFVACGDSESANDNIKKKESPNGID